MINVLIHANNSFQILTGTSSTKVRCAKVIVVDIDKNEEVLNQIKHYLINPVDQRIASLENQNI